MNSSKLKEATDSYYYSNRWCYVPRQINLQFQCVLTRNFSLTCIAGGIEVCVGKASKTIVNSLVIYCFIIVRLFIRSIGFLLI